MEETATPDDPANMAPADEAEAARWGAEAEEASRCVTRHRAEISSAQTHRRPAIHWFDAWTVAYQSISAVYAPQAPRVLEIDFVGLDRTYQLGLHFSSRVHLSDPCNAIRTMTMAPVFRRGFPAAAFGNLVAHKNCSGCCAELSSQNAFDVIVTHGVSNISECIGSLQPLEGGFLVLENVTSSIVQEILSFPVAEQFAAVTATVRMVIVETRGTATPMPRPKRPGTSPREGLDPLASNATLNELLSGMRLLSNLPEPSPFVLNRPRRAENIPIVLKKKIVMLRATATDICVLSTQFGDSLQTLVAIDTGGKGSGCTLSSAVKVEKRSRAWFDTTNDTFDIAIDMAGHFDRASASLTVTLQTILPKIREYFVIISPLLSEFTDMSKLLVSEALPHDLSQILSISLYHNAAFVRKVESFFSFSLRSVGRSVRVRLCFFFHLFPEIGARVDRYVQVPERYELVPPSPLGASPPNPWLQEISDDGGRWLNCSNGSWAPPATPKRLHDFGGGACEARRCMATCCMPCNPGRLSLY